MPCRSGKSFGTCNSVSFAERGKLLLCVTESATGKEVAVVSAPILLLRTPVVTNIGVGPLLPPVDRGMTRGAGVGGDTVDGAGAGRAADVRSNKIGSAGEMTVVVVVVVVVVEPELEVEIEELDAGPLDPDLALTFSITILGTPSAPIAGVGLLVDLFRSLPDPEAAAVVALLAIPVDNIWLYRATASPTCRFVQAANSALDSRELARIPSSSVFWVSTMSTVEAVESFLDDWSWSWLVLSTCSSAVVDDLSMDGELSCEEGSELWDVLFMLALVALELGSGLVGVTSLASW